MTTRRTITVTDCHGQRSRIRADKWEIGREPDDMGTLTVLNGGDTAAVFVAGGWTGFVCDRFAVADGTAKEG